MTNISKLKGKGAPPAAATAPRHVDAPPREKGETIKALQFKVTEDMFEAFSREAFDRFGSGKGAKKALFEAMWQEYQTHKS
jgi:hypothetical protein